MGFSNTSNLDRVRHYEQAHAYFTSKPRPRGSEWGENERPLGTNHQHHYRLVKGYDGQYYDMVLYSTSMARYYKPEADGSYRVCYTHDSRNTSSNFMWHAVGVWTYPKLRATDGTERIVPIGGSRSFGTDLWFNAQGELIVERSTHAPMATVHASKALTEWKKELRAYLGNLPPLMEIAIQDTLDAGEGNGGWRAGGAFTSVDVPYIVREILQDMCDSERGGVNAQQVEALRDLYTLCAEFIIDRRLKKAVPRNRWSRSNSVPYTTPKASAVTTSVINYLAKYAPYSVTRKEYRPIEKFLTELPKSAVFI